MTLTVTAPSVGARVGPGIFITVHTDIVGPIASDDGFYAVCIDTAFTAPLVWGKSRANGQRDVPVQLGVQSYVPVLGQVIGRGRADGASVGFYLELQHANGITVESSYTAASWNWDPTTGLWSLITAPAGVDPAKIDLILAALYRTFQS